MPSTLPLAEALAAVSPDERRAVLDEAARLRRDQCRGGDALLGLVDREASQRVAELAKALADPVRAELIGVLRRHGGEVCQCDLQPLFAVSQPTLSHHLRRLVEAGLVTVERRGRWACYAVDPEALETLRVWLS